MNRATLADYTRRFWPDCCSSKPSCLVLIILGHSLPCCRSCQRDLPALLRTFAIVKPTVRVLATVAALAALVIGCAGSSTTENAPPASSSSCESFAWELDEGGLAGCAVPGDPACGLSWCAGRPVPQTVHVGCEQPRASCAPAERSGRPDAWCCW